MDVSMNPLQAIHLHCRWYWESWELWFGLWELLNLEIYIVNVYIQSIIEVLEGDQVVVNEVIQFGHEFFLLSKSLSWKIK